MKVWRLFGDIIVDVGITLEMLAPLFPKQFLLCICLASVRVHTCRMLPVSKAAQSV